LEHGVTGDGGGGEITSRNKSSSSMTKMVGMVGWAEGGQAV
jgi:hypothetical protein